MKKILIFSVILILTQTAVRAQVGSSAEKMIDSLRKASPELYDSLMNELGGLLDTIAQVRSNFGVSMGVGNGYFINKSTVTTSVTSANKLIYTPALNYFHKSGLSFSATAYMLFDDKKPRFYQYTLSPAYDYLRNRNFSAGISYARYFNQSSDNYYNNPVQNEFYAYFKYKKPWLRPGIALTRGTGKYDETYTVNSFLRPDTFFRFTFNYAIKDFSTILSLQHEFNWDRVFNNDDDISITPTMMLIAGSQQLNGNRNINTFVKLRNGATVQLPGTRTGTFTETNTFKANALAMLLTLDYDWGKFFFQPQCFLNYALPKPTDGSKRFSTMVSVNAGFVF